MFYQIVADNCLFVRKIRSSSFNFFPPFRCMPNLGQEWLCHDRIEHSVGRQNACSYMKSTIPREIVLDDGKDEKYYSVISVLALARASRVMSEPLSIRAIS